MLIFIKIDEICKEVVFVQAQLYKELFLFFCFFLSVFIGFTPGSLFFHFFSEDHWGTYV